MGGAFGGRLKELRKAAGYTQAQFSERLNVHLQTVSKWERGVSEPDIALLGEMAAALNVLLERLIGAPIPEQPFAGAFDSVRFGKKLCSARKSRGEGQEAVARVCDTTPDIVSKWERGVVCPDIERLLCLAEHFGEPVSKLYFGITDGDKTETPAQAKRRRRFSFAWAGVCAVLLTAVVCLAVLLPQSGEVYSVKIGGAEYEVSADDWFTPQTPSREGYDFIGFADGAGNIVSFPRKITEDADFTALFSPREYKIDYWLNGGMFLSDAEYTFTVESGALELPLPQKAGADFEGWYLSPDYAGEPVESVECACSDIKLYAKWSDAVFTVRYELNGGSLSASNPAEITAEQSFQLAEPVRRGYNFLGWYDEPQGGKRYESVGGENAKNLTLYALWQESGALYTVLYNACGGEVLGENPASVGAGEVHSLYGAQKAGYDFIGWNTAPDGSGDWFETLYGIRENLELYAVYSPKTYTVVYELDGGTYYKGVNPNKIEYGEEAELFPVAKAGHTFLGWFDAKTGGNRVERIDAGNILRLRTVYARFSANEYTVLLNGGGGKFTVNGETYEQFEYTLRYGERSELPACTLAGYDFLGWYDEKGALVEAITAENIGDMVLTAKYREAGLTYAITYELNGGVQSPRNPSAVAYGQVVELYAPTREGYLFLGWNDRADGSGEYYEATTAGRESDLTLYAVWQEITVSGSADDFNYEMGRESVTITGYTGAFGKNVDLVIPSYIEGKPVVAVEGRFDRYTESHPQTFYLHSLVIPETVGRLGANTFNHMTITEPVVIPASVKEIGRECFRTTEFSLCFAENSALKEIGEYAFAGSYVENIPVLPHGLERLESYAFYGAWVKQGGIILPDTLQFIGGYALHISAGSSNQHPQLYLPSSVRELEARAFGGESVFVRVYTALTAEQTSRFIDGWDENAEITYLEREVSGITLRCGEQEKRLEGHSFALPFPEREGYTFFGWYDAETDFVNGNYIPLREGVVLDAVFEEKTASDGRSEYTPALLESGKEYEFIVFSNEKFYFKPDVASGERYRLVYAYSAVCCSDNVHFLSAYNAENTAYYSGVSYTFGGEPLYLLADGTGGHIYRCTYRVKIRVEAV